MVRLPSALSAVVILTVGALAVVFSNSGIVTRTFKTVNSTASSTLVTSPGFTAQSITFQNSAAPKLSINTRTAVPPRVAASARGFASTTAFTTQQMPPKVPGSQTMGSANLTNAASRLRNALVNIICYAPAGSSIHSISGSGVFINSKGIILTNAHIAQYFLLSDRGVSCTIRTGSPAAAAYDAALMYISPAWVHANVGVITETAPSGTGEYDFALLAVTKSATTAALPSSFPSVPLAMAPPAVATPVVIATYGAQFLTSDQIQFSLFPTIVLGSVKSVFTFATDTVDVLALGGSAAAQEGSSGGGVIDSSGLLIGTVTTSTVTGTTATRSLDAITASYIRAEYARETNSTLNALLGESTTTAVTNFEYQIPTLEAILTAGLN